MSVHPPRPLAAVVAALALACLAAADDRLPAENPAAEADKHEPRGGRVPPVPDGSPEELLQYVGRIGDPAAIPRSRGRQRYYLKKAGAALVEAADKILAQVPADAPLHAEAVRIKLDGFAMLDEMGDKEAIDAMTAFCRTLVDHPNPAIARRARRMTLAGDVDALYAARSAAGAEPLIDRAAALLDAGDDPATARIAAQLAEDLARLPAAEAVAKRAHEAFVPRLAKSGDPQVQKLGERLAVGLRRLGLLGQPLRLEGRLTDGAAFDPTTVAGKVVLVDFWATWCKPCVAEMPHIRALYEKYRDRGLEVVGISLDDDPEAVVAFVADNGVAWPVICGVGADAGWDHPLAVRYGIQAIPAMFLVGRDGNVISVNAQGEMLDTLLAEQFPDAP